MKKYMSAVRSVRHDITNWKHYRKSAETIHMAQLYVACIVFVQTNGYMNFAALKWIKRTMLSNRIT